MCMAPVSLSIGLITEWMMSAPSGSASIAHRAFAPAASILQALHAPPKHVVLPTCVNADDGPHSMVVRHDHHSGRPNYVDDGECIRMKKFLDSGALRLPQSFEDCRRIGDRTG